MNLQQLEYIVAVDQYRHFVRASKACGVTQPTLSMMIQKLEAELDITIFDRSKQPLEPTPMGEKIIQQAKASLREMNKIKELVEEETTTLSGSLKIGVIPTLAPYLIPQFIKIFNSNYPEIQLNITERNTNSLINALKYDEVDMFIAATPLEVNDFYEIPLYYEKFIAYFAEDHPLKDVPITADSIPQDNLWVLEEGHCLRDQIFNFCTTSMNYNHVFEAGSIDTLIRIIDINGGYTLIPELHLDFLTKAQRANTRELAETPAIREISLVIHKSYLKERMLNAVADSIKEIIPKQMIDERLKKFSIKL